LRLLEFLDTLEEPVTSPLKKVHTYTEEIHEGDVEKMLSDLSVGEGEKWNKIALPDRVVDALEEPVCEDVSREEQIGLSVMAYLDTHIKHDKSLVCRGVTLKDAREWIRRQIAKQDEPVCEELEEAAKQFVGYDMDTDNLRDYEVGIQSFIAGANWYREQMMKGAVEIVYEPGHIEPAFYMDKLPDINAGDKLRLIIIKED